MQKNTTYFSCSFSEIHNVKSGTITKYIKFSVYVANLTSLKDDPEIYNQLMFFKSLPK
jgi:hypothetical protein